MQTVRNQTTSAFQELAIFVAKCVQLIALHIQDSENVPVLVPHWDNDL